jgi:acetyl-CoA synthetase
VGLYLESLPDPVALARVARQALDRRVPVVVLKAGSSDLGAAVTLSHTSSLAGPDAMSDALFRRLGFARVHELGTLLQALTLLHVHGALPGARITSASCSGGEAAHVADLAARHEIEVPMLPASVERRLCQVLGDRVAVRNPLDYHTYIWGNRDVLVDTFTALLDTSVDLHLLVLDLPRVDRCDGADWRTALDAFVTAQQRSGARAAVVTSLAEGMPEPLAEELLAAGIVPLQGIGDAMRAVAAAAQIGCAQRDAASWLPPDPPGTTLDGDASMQLDEATAKGLLRAAGLSVPDGVVVRDAAECGEAADHLGYPLVLKLVSSSVAHKSVIGGVATDLRDRREVVSAFATMKGLGERFLVEAMVRDARAELLVGVQRHPHTGLLLTVGAGGVLVELLKDSANALLPTSRAEVLAALQRLRIWPLLTADVDEVVAAVVRIADCARDLGDALIELEVNPLLVCAGGAVAVDALIRLTGPPPAVPAPPPLQQVRA